MVLSAHPRERGLEAFAVNISGFTIVSPHFATEGRKTATGDICGCEVIGQ